VYTNGDNGNGHERTKLTLSDLRSDSSDIATIDDFQETLDGRGRERNAGRDDLSESSLTAKAQKSGRGAASTPWVEKPGANESLGEDDEDAGTELLERDEKRGGLRRAVVGIGIAACALFVIAIATYLWLFSGSDESYRVRNTASRSRAEAGARNDNSPQALTVEEIARELNRGGNSNTASNANQEAAPDAATNGGASETGGGSPVTDRLPLGDFSTTVTPQTGADAPVPAQSTVAQNATGQSSQVDTTAGGATTGRDAATTRSGATVGSPNPERSIRVSALAANGRRESSPSVSANLNLSQPASPERATESVPLPPLGTMLPVRTLGSLYTLRSEGYVRMQLAREVSGRGWSLARGTELYGVVRGSDFEIGRAYIQLVGFIDQRSGRLVRIQGSLLGADGADGLRGRKHSLTSGWSRALRVAGAGALEALSTVAATVGRRPVYVGDVYGSGAPRVTSPLMQELNGIAYRQGRAGYIEVPAGTSGYILVMTSPREVQGVDADVNVPVDDLRRSSDVNTQRGATQLSETELAELMTSGNREDIRRALPRMTPEMRRVAEAVLAGQ
jgi:hypothetical protein